MSSPLDDIAALDPLTRREVAAALRKVAEIVAEVRPPRIGQPERAQPSRRATAAIGRVTEDGRLRLSSVALGG